MHAIFVPYPDAYTMILLLRDTYKMKSEVIQYMRDNHDDPILQNAINTAIKLAEQLHVFGEHHTTYSYASYDNYLDINVNPWAFLGQPEVQYAD